MKPALFRDEPALREADPRSALWLISVEKLFNLETFLCRIISARRRVWRSLSAPVQHGKPLSHTSCKRGGGPPLCRASSEHRGRRLLSGTVGRRRRRAPLSRAAGNRSARVNYGDCRAPSLRGSRGFRRRSLSASLGEELLFLSRSGKGRGQKRVCTRVCKWAPGLFTQSRCVAASAGTSPSYDFYFSPSLFFLPI